MSVKNQRLPAVNYYHKALHTKVNNIILSHNDKFLKDENKVAKTLNDYFTNLTKKLKLKPITFNDTVNSFENHDSVGKINDTAKTTKASFHLNLNNLKLMNCMFLSCHVRVSE